MVGQQAAHFLSQFSFFTDCLPAILARADKNGHLLVPRTGSLEGRVIVAGPVRRYDRQAHYLECEQTRDRVHRALLHLEKDFQPASCDTGFPEKSTGSFRGEAATGWR